MNAPLTAEMFDKNETALISAVKNHHTLGREHANAKRALEERQAEALSKKEVEGKNADERAAKMRKLFPDLYEAERDAGEALENAKLALELARIRRDTLRYKLRLVERIREGVMIS